MPKRNKELIVNNSQDRHNSKVDIKNENLSSVKFKRAAKRDAK